MGTVLTLMFLESAAGNFYVSQGLLSVINGNGKFKLATYCSMKQSESLVTVGLAVMIVLARQKQRSVVTTIYLYTASFHNKSQVRQWWRRIAPTQRCRRIILCSLFVRVLVSITSICVMFCKYHCSSWVSWSSVTHCNMYIAPWSFQSVSNSAIDDVFVVTVS